MVESRNITITQDLKKVYEWACKLTSEQGYEEYLWTPETEALVRRLLTSKGDMIAVVGLQGVGKTALREALEIRLEQSNRKVFSLKWLGSLKETIVERIRNVEDGFLSEYDDRYFDHLFDEMWERSGERRGPQYVTVAVIKYLGATDTTGDLRSWIMRYVEARNRRLSKKNSDFEERQFEENELRMDLQPRLMPLMESRLGSGTVQQIRDERLRGMLQTADVLLIDLPDYDRSNIAQMRKDLTSIQEWWDNVFTDHYEHQRQKTSLVVFFQKELFRGHFLMGKLDVYELKPLTPEQLLECYRMNFGSNAPFTDEALLMIGKISRGIFRRFKKYIRVCLDRCLVKPNDTTITPGNVREWITLDQLVADMELELATIFPKEKECRLASVIVLRKLSEEGTLTQSQITEQVFDSAEMKASRVLNRLEAWNYIKRERKAKEKVVSLA